MNELFSQILLPKIASLWHKPLVGLSVAILVPASMFLSTADNNNTTLVAIIAAAIFIFLTALWLYTNQVPKNPKGKVGIAIAILADKQDEAQQIEFDFVRVLRQLLQRDPAGGNFHLIVLPDHITEQIDDSDSAQHFLKKTRSHFMLYGHAKLRHLHGKQVHVLSLEGIVRHAPIPKEVSDRLANDFRQVLPRRLLLPQDIDAIAFDVTSGWVDLSARYIVGLAAHISGDILYAEKLFLNVEHSMETAKHLAGVLQPIARSLPRQIVQLYRDWLRALGDHYFMTHERTYMEQADIISDKLLGRDPNDYDALIFKSFAEFVLRRNIQAARELVRRCRRIRDVTWRYNLAFLYAYEGDLDSANEEYRKAFRGTLRNPTVPIQCEEFLQIVLEEEPDKEHLYFCLGLINYSAKRDYTAAARDFDRFFKSSAIKKFPNARTIAENLKGKCGTPKGQGIG